MRLQCVDAGLQSLGDVLESLEVDDELGEDESVSSLYM
jgi:hypothetical protein